MSVDSHESGRKVAERLGEMGDLADLGLEEHVRAQHCADLLGVRPRHRPDLVDGSLGRSMMPGGGHFTAAEEPLLVADDLRYLMAVTS